MLALKKASVVEATRVQAPPLRYCRGNLEKQEVAVPPRPLTQERRGLGLRRGSKVRTYSTLVAVLALSLPLVFSFCGSLYGQRGRRASVFSPTASSTRPQASGPPPFYTHVSPSCVLHSTS